jgi:putative oxidoreductase
LVFGALDTVLSWEAMLDFGEYLDVLGFPLPLVSAVVSAYAQLMAGLAWMIGYRVKVFSILMIGNFVVAILFVHIAGSTPYVEAAPAVHMLVFSVVLLLTGPGALALESRQRMKAPAAEGVESPQS